MYITEVIEIKNRIPDSYIWNKKEQKYFYSNGKEVPKTRIDKLFTDILDKLKEKNNKLTQDLIDKKISISQWKQQFFNNLKYAEINTFLINVGGAENILKKEIKILNRNLKKKYQYFNKFNEDIKSGISEAQLKYRSNRYNESISSAKSNGDLINKFKLGYTHAYRLLGQAEHCADCINYFNQGVVSLNKFTPIKTNCICQERCKCTAYFFKSLEDAVKSFNNL